MRIITMFLIIVVVFTIIPNNVHADPILAEPPIGTIIIATSIIGGASVLTYFLIDHFIDISRLKNIQFSSEDVSIYINSNNVQVEGKYYFRNTDTSDREIELKFPFFVDEGVGSPTEISVYVDGELIHYFKKAGDEVKFKVLLPARSEKEVTVTFNQPCLNGNYTYILTTVKRWGRPLESARFSIYTDGVITDVVSSYPLSQQIDDEGTRYYVMTQENFMPDKDLIIKWNSENK